MSKSDVCRRLYTSESDVCRRQILTYKDGPALKVLISIAHVMFKKLSNMVLYIFVLQLTFFY